MNSEKTPSIPALYCHIPFCHSICPYCAFPLHGNRRELHPPYLSALKAELALRGGEFTGGPAAGSLYIGGGTPSALSLADLGGLLAAIRRHFPLAPGHEAAIEINPEDADPGYLAGLLELGFNRVSLGLQSLNEAALTALGRRNGPGEGRRALEALRAGGFDNYNVDLLVGAPGVPESVLLDDLEEVLAGGPAHISIYLLDIEPGTLFARRSVAAGSPADRRESQAAPLFLAAAELLKSAGYRHYEVSNFCLPGREGRQNLLVWGGGNYLGFGAGAHSHLEGRRWYNHRHIRPYQRALASGVEPVAYQEELTAGQRANEELMLGLRRDEWFDTAAWAAAQGIVWGEKREAIVRGLAAVGRIIKDGKLMRLTSAGMLVADEITLRLMLP